MPQTNRQIHLISRPEKEPDLSNFALVEAPRPTPAEGQILLHTIYLSLDPYMRARMYDGANYATSSPLNAPMVGTSLAHIIESRHPSLKAGEYVVAPSGWQEYFISNGAGLSRIDPNLAPLTTALSVLGLPGHTAYGALTRFGEMKRGETLLVSAAAGGVGSVAAQMGRIKGLRVVGIAGGEDKCRYLTDEFGLAAAVDRRDAHFVERLQAACPDGVDIYFDNVAGDTAKTVLSLMNDYGRYLVCGTIAVNRDLGFPEGKDNLQEVLATVLVKRLRVQGFLFADFLDLEDDFKKDVSGWVRSGALKYREHIVDGIENAPKAFLSLFNGGNFGKLLVKIME